MHTWVNRCEVFFDIFTTQTALKYRTCVLTCYVSHYSGANINLNWIFNPHIIFLDIEMAQVDEIFLLEAVRLS